MGSAALTLPAQVVKPADYKEDQAQASQEGDKTHGTPDISLDGGPVAHQGLIRPVVCVGIVLARPVRRRRPGGPRKKGGQRLELRGVLDIAGRQSRSAALLGEVIAPFDCLGAIGRHLSGGIVERPRGRFIPILLENSPHFRGRDDLLIRRELCEGFAVLLHRDRIARYLAEPVQILRAVVRPQISPVTPKGSVLHEAVFKENLLAFLDVGSCEHHISRSIHGLVGNGRSVRVG